MDGLLYGRSRETRRVIFFLWTFRVIVLLLGLLSSFLGLVFLTGCFTRVDSEAFIARASGNEAKIANLRSLQASWDKLGRTRQFLSSSLGFLIFGAGLLLVWYDTSFADYYLVVPALYVANLVSLVSVNKHATAALTSGSYGDLQVKRVIKQNMRMCVTFGIIYVPLVTKI